MRILRGLLGSVLWILATVVGLVAVVLCITIILLPIGIPLLLLSRRLFGASGRVLLPRGVRHPFEETGKAARKQKRNARKRAKKLDIGSAKKKKTPGEWLSRRRKRLPLVG